MASTSPHFLSPIFGSSYQNFFTSYSFRQKLLYTSTSSDFAISHFQQALSLNSAIQRITFLFCLGISLKLLDLVARSSSVSCTLSTTGPEVQIVYAQDSLLITSPLFTRAKSLLAPSFYLPLFHALLEIKLRALHHPLSTSIVIFPLLDSSAAHNRFHLSCLLHRLSCYWIPLLNFHSLMVILSLRILLKLLTHTVHLNFSIGSWLM